MHLCVSDLCWVWRAETAMSIGAASSCCPSQLSGSASELQKVPFGYALNTTVLMSDSKLLDMTRLISCLYRLIKLASLDWSPESDYWKRTPRRIVSNEVEQALTCGKSLKRR